MVRAVTEAFHEMVLEVDMTVPVVVTSLSSANPAVVTVGVSDIAKFTNGMVVLISGALGVLSGANGDHAISSVGTPANSFTLTGVSTSGGVAQTTGVKATPGPSGTTTWGRICGLNERGVNRTHNMQTSEVPDCDDESLPAAVERAVQSSEVTVAASGVWAAQSHPIVMDWWYSAQPKSIRIQNMLAAVGDTEYETGYAYLTSLNNVATRGQKVTADMTIEFDGLPTRTAQT